MVALLLLWPPTSQWWHCFFCGHRHLKTAQAAGPPTSPASHNRTSAAARSRRLASSITRWRRRRWRLWRCWRRSWTRTRTANGDSSSSSATARGLPTAEGPDGATTSVDRRQGRTPPGCARRHLAPETRFSAAAKRWGLWGRTRFSAAAKSWGLRGRTRFSAAAKSWGLRGRTRFSAAAKRWRRWPWRWRQIRCSGAAVRSRTRTTCCCRALSETVAAGWRFGPGPGRGRERGRCCAWPAETRASPPRRTPACSPGVPPSSPCSSTYPGLLSAGEKEEVKTVYLVHLDFVFALPGGGGWWCGGSHGAKR